MREEEEKQMKENGVFKSAMEEHQAELSKASRNKSWSSSTQKIKETDCQDDMGVKSKTEPIVNYHEGKRTQNK